MYSKRRRSVLLEAEKIGCTVVAASSPENVFYTTGFWGTGLTLLTSEGLTLFTNSLEGERAIMESKDCDVRIISKWDKVWENISEDFLNGNICVDEIQMLSSESRMRKLSRRVIYNSEVFYKVRRVKDRDEITSLRKASNMIDNLYRVVEEQTRNGVTERAIASKLLAEMVENGCDPPLVHSTTSPLIVASGPNSAHPHIELTNRRIRKGEFIVIDLTVRCNGYVADATRTFAVGEVSLEMKKVYEAVNEAQEAGVESVNEQAIGGEIDLKTRNVINENQFGQYFTHSTGHGVGLEVHEPPWIRSKSKDILQKGETITVEPGIYIPNRFGVRIEDTILVSNGGKSMTNFPRELISIG